MTRLAFLADRNVQEMLPWVAARFDTPPPWTHTYVDRKTDDHWSCDSLAGAFRQYRWKDEGWRENKKKLDCFRRKLREAVDQSHPGCAFDVCEKILRWGGVSAHNVAYLKCREQQCVLLDELRHLRAVLAGDRTPTRKEMRRDPSDEATECRMNAGFVKIYSLLCEYCVIYDGRVGAALGLLVRQFCQATGRGKVPASLAFAFGDPKEARDAKCPKLRDPGRNGLGFPKLRSDSRFHTAQVMQANWFLRAALESAPWPCGAGEDGFHELAAGLFMVGYDLRDATGPCCRRRGR